ncbi:hypothetical protein [Actinoallomurus iriomotensis]|uniref:Uncharacterized protein n=1 Tax=Actinoallomurus iriomotensis TaxID=478107 RepID=A0A9W6VNY3_9ACTN|nr:hypothetical protein [Actinoallomurus iriomotensis]GLY75185.1 hypothetical protein Airi01_034520 [Actinoallomurus iriomotensis]
MVARRQETESVEDVRSRLLARFPEDAAEVNRQFNLAVACADHLGVRLTPPMLENLVVERLQAKAAARPPRISPAVPLVCRRPRSGDTESRRPGSTWGGKRTTSSTGDS